MMKVSGLHLLLTFQCTFECDHCFVWGSPWQSGTMDISMIRKILAQARDSQGVRSIYFEGGEPFLYYATLLSAVEESAAAGFDVGIVSNAFWATSLEDAMLNLEPFKGLLKDLTVSSDLFHYNEIISKQAKNAAIAAERLGIPVGMITIDRQEADPGGDSQGQLETGESGVMYRGRAAEKLASQAPQKAWDSFTTCPHENLVDPGRVHIDPKGNIHLCQGLTIGSMLASPIQELLDQYIPEQHPVVGPLLRGGPKELVETYNLPHLAYYADACHLCYKARSALRREFPQYLAPDQVYGVMN